MADLDSALLGAASYEDVAALLQEGYDEHYQIDLISMYLLDHEHSVWLSEHRLTVADVLNGRFPIGLDVQFLFDNWNEKLGTKQFGFFR
jgi:hypothetical protein